MRRALLLLLLLLLPLLAAPASAQPRGDNAPLTAVAPAPSLEPAVPASSLEKADEKYAVDTAAQRTVEPGLTPKAPELERLAEREAQIMLWDQQLPAAQAQMIDEAKRALEQGRGHGASALCGVAPKAAAASKEVDAIQAALKRIKRLPAEEREPARRELRTCIDRVVPPPGAPTPRAKPVEAPKAPRLSPAQQERCRVRNLFGC